MKKIAVTIAFAAIAVAGYSQQVVTLQQCRGQALQNNRNVKQSELDKRIAVAHQKEARASYLPQIDGSGSIMNLPDMPSDNQQETIAIADIKSVTVRKYEIELTLKNSVKLINIKNLKPEQMQRVRQQLEAIGQQCKKVE